MTTPVGHLIVFGAGEETAYGTAVAATKFLEIDDESLGLAQSNIARTTLQSVSMKYKVPSKRSVAGSISFPMLYQGAEMLLKHALGGSVASALIASSVYEHVFALGASLPTGLTLHIGRDASAWATAYDYSGCKINKLTLAQDMEAMLKCTIDVIGKDEAEQTVATATYPTAKMIDWSQISTLTIAGTAVQGRMAEFTIENPLADDEFKLGTRTRVAAFRKSPRKVTGKIMIEPTAKTQYDLFRALTDTAIVATWTGPVAGGSTNYLLTITIPVANFSGKSLATKDHGPYELELPFEAFYDITNSADEIQIKLRNLLTSVP